LLDVVTIAGEVDSQLKQAMISYVAPKVIRISAWGRNIDSGANDSLHA
jgi:hypothetical protein